MTTLSQSRELLDYLWTDPTPPELSDEERQRVRTAADALRQVEWQPEAIEAALEAVLERLGSSKNQLFKPIRLALTGKTVSPPIHHTLALLPRDTALARLDRVAVVHS
jgi:glutamyl-tRNA synthetase